MSAPLEPTPVELMTIAGSRLLRDGRVVFAGVGSPLEASVLAKRLHAPSLTIVLEGGSIGPRMLPGRLPVSTNEMRAAHERNDEVLERIYIGRRFKNDTERLEKLFELYTKMTAKQTVAIDAAKVERKKKVAK